MTDGARKRIAIFTTDDSVWALPTWQTTIPELARHYDVVGIHLFPDVLGKRRGSAAMRWYLDTFGFWTCALLGLYAIKTRLRSIGGEGSSWARLAAAHGLDLARGDDPNADSARAWLIAHKIDVLFIMVGFILEPRLLEACRVGAINKHAALLPSCRGVFPYFWARLRGLPAGITFHKVDARIDSGPILCQVAYPPRASAPSLLRFYIDVFAVYHRLAPLAVERLIAGASLPPADGVTASYFSFPSREDYREYRRQGHALARISDLFYQPSLTLEGRVR